MPQPRQNPNASSANVNPRNLLSSTSILFLAVSIRSAAFPRRRVHSIFKEQFNLHNQYIFRRERSPSEVIPQAMRAGLQVLAIRFQASRPIGSGRGPGGDEFTERSK